jgi:hypothetical protein
MPLLVVLGIWIVVSAAVAPIVGYFLAGHRARKTRANAGYRMGLRPDSRPRT